MKGGFQWCQILFRIAFLCMALFFLMDLMYTGSPKVNNGSVTTVLVVFILLTVVTYVIITKKKWRQTCSQCGQLVWQKP